MRDRIRRCWLELLMVLVMVVAGYFGVGAFLSLLLPRVELPLWLVRVLSWVFEAVFVALFGLW